MRKYLVTASILLGVVILIFAHYLSHMTWLMSSSLAAWIAAVGIRGAYVN